MKIEDARKLTKDLDDEGLAAMADAVNSEVRDRQPKVSLDSIRPGMSADERKAVYGAIQQAVKEL